jgi:hypothetical protein
MMHGGHGSSSRATEHGRIKERGTMKRIVLTDGSGRWFDIDKAERFDEDTYWDGRNMISKATGSQWHHEVLYRTAGGKWILHRWSQWQGDRESWTEVTDDAAAAWLVTNGYEPHPACAREYEALEIA